MRDTVLDWEDDLPVDDLSQAELHSTQSDFSLCLGTTLQILPSGKMPLKVKKNNGKLVICNLQPTQYVSLAHIYMYIATNVNLMVAVIEIN